MNAVKHEMNEAIARTVELASSNLGDLNKKSVDNLIAAIIQSGKRTLTPSESQYLRSLIARAMNQTQPMSSDES